METLEPTKLQYSCLKKVDFSKAEKSPIPFKDARIICDHRRPWRHWDRDSQSPINAL